MIKDFVRFHAKALDLKGASGAIMHKRYPWFLNFYKRDGHPDGFYPIFGLFRSRMMEKTSFITGLVSIQFILVSDWKTVIGYSGHSDVFRQAQFNDAHYVVDPNKILHFKEET